MRITHRLGQVSMIQRITEALRVTETRRSVKACNALPKNIGGKGITQKKRPRSAARAFFQNRRSWGVISPFQPRYRP